MLSANAVLLGLRVAVKKVAQELIHLHDSIFVLFLGGLEHLLDLFKLHLGRLLVPFGTCLIRSNRFMLQVL